MTLIRQICLLLIGTLVLAFAASLSASIGAARGMLGTQLQLQNNNAAATLALALTQQKGDAAMMDLLLSAQFDTGAYERIRYLGSDGHVTFQREHGLTVQRAPVWFVDVLPVRAEPGIAQVSDGWRALGRVEVLSQAGFAHDALWSGSVRALGWLLAAGLLAGAAALSVLRRIRRPLERVVEQAQALERGDFVLLDEPAVPELRRLAQAMNSLVGRLKRVFEAQAGQVAELQRQAHGDPLTGISNRAHFMGRFAAMLEREDGAGEGGLVLLRVLQLAEVNRALGHVTTDRVICAIAQTLQTYQRSIEGCFIGRLNGSDFALSLPAGGVAAETAQALTQALRVMLPAFGPKLAVAAGAVEVRRGVTSAQVMGEADLALARAETGVPFSVVEAASWGEPVLAGLGAAVWRQRLQAALDEGRARLAGFAVVSVGGRLIHRECPLRIQLEAGGAFEVAARWLPLAVRSRLTGVTDERAVALALADIERDGVPRCINIAPASLSESGFALRLHALAADAPRAARLLWIEVSESAAVERFDAMRELGRLLRPLGVRYGLEHAGERLSGIERLFEAGLDYVKLDASVTRGVAGDAARAGFVKGLVTLLRSLSLQVYGEGVASEADATELTACGLDGLTGPLIGPVAVNDAGFESA